MENLGEKEASKKFLKMDYDTRDIKAILERLSVIEKFVGRIFNISAWKVKTSPSGRGYHVEIEIEPLIDLDDRDIVILQLILGSDPMREMFNWFRVKGGLKKWNVLFDKKIRASKLLGAKNVGKNCNKRNSKQRIA